MKIVCFLRDALTRACLSPDCSMWLTVSDGTFLTDREKASFLAAGKLIAGTIVDNDDDPDSVSGEAQELFKLEQICGWAMMRRCFSLRFLIEPVSGIPGDPSGTQAITIDWTSPTTGAFEETDAHLILSFGTCEQRRWFPNVVWPVLSATVLHLHVSVN
jgi:hypothetical protein